MSSRPARQVEEYLSAEELARRLSLHVRTIKRWKRLYEATQGRDGLGPWVKFGRNLVRVSAGAVNGFLERRRV